MAAVFVSNMGITILCILCLCCVWHSQKLKTGTHSTLHEAFNCCHLASTLKSFHCNNNNRQQQQQQLQLQQQLQQQQFHVPNANGSQIRDNRVLYNRQECFGVSVAKNVQNRRQTKAL